MELSGIHYPVTAILFCVIQAFIRNFDEAQKMDRMLWQLGGARSECERFRGRTVFNR